MTDPLSINLLSARAIGIILSAALTLKGEARATPREVTPMSDGGLRTPQASAVGVCQRTVMIYVTDVLNLAS